MAGEFIFPRDEYGMPSSHSAFGFWVATYVLLQCFWRGGGYSQTFRVSVSVGAVLFAFSVAFSRCYLLYHFPEQAVAGACFGLVLSGAWFWLTVALLQPKIFPWVEELTIARWLLLKDSSGTDGILEVEYHESRK